MSIYTRSYLFLHNGHFCELNTLPSVVSDNSIDKFSASLYSSYCCGFSFSHCSNILSKKSIYFIKKYQLSRY